MRWSRTRPPSEGAGGTLAADAGAAARRVMILATAIAMAVMLAAPAVAEAAPPWPVPEGNAQATGQSSIPGPEDPGLKWHLDLDKVATDFAPEGYSSVRDRLLLSDAGTLIVRAENRDPQYEDSARFSRELVGIDADTAEVLWEVPNVTASSQNRCDPAIDSQDRVWIEQRPDGDDRVVRAFDAATGEPSGPAIPAEDDRCRNQPLIGGASDHLVFGGPGDDPAALRLFDISGDAPTEIPTGIGALDGADDLVNQSNHDGWGVFTDDMFITAVGFDDGARIELVAMSLEDGSVSDRLDLPTPAGASSSDYSRAHLMLDGDTLVVSLVSSRGDSPGAYLAGVNVDGGLSPSWGTPLEGEPSDLTLGDGAVLLQEGNRTTLGAPRLKAIATDSGDVIYDDGVRGGEDPLTNPDGSGYTSSRTSGMTRDQLITLFDPQGQVVWTIPPERIVQHVDGVDERDDLNMGNRFAQLRFAAIGHDGTLFVTAGAGQGILAIDNSGGLAVPAEVRFPDVDPDSVHAPNIEELARRGITTGDADGNYNPDGLVTRAQFATFLVRALELEPIEGASTFDDVDPGSVHTPNIEAAAEAEITTGTTPTTFDPNGHIIRAQVASLLARAFDLEGIEEGPFADVDPDSVHAPNINAVAEAGITTGTTATTFNPEGQVTRAQMASLLIRALDSVDP